MARVWVRTFMVALAVAVVIAALAGCTSTSRGTGSRGTTAAAICPPHGAEPGWLDGGKSTGQLVPAGPVSLVECSYPGEVVRNGQKEPYTGSAHGPVIRDAPAIAGYLAMMGQEPALRPSCWQRAVDDGRQAAHGSNLLLFGYPGGRTWVLDVGGRCEGVAGPDGLGIRADDSAGEFLVGLGPINTFGRTHPAPVLVGLSLRDAARRDPDLVVMGEIVEASAAGPTIAVADVPAGSPVNGNQINVMVAVPPAPRCRASQLRASLTGGEPGAGTAFASLVLRDVGKQSCTLQGPMRLSALGSADQVLAVTSVGVQGTGTSPLVLSPSPSGVGRRVESGLAAHALLSSTDFAGNCGTSDRPSGWQVALSSGVVRMVADPEIRSRFAVIVCNDAIYSGPFTEPGQFAQ